MTSGEEAKRDEGAAGARPSRPGSLPALLALLLGVGTLLVLTVLIFLRFVGPILMALVIAAVARPLFGTMRRLVGEQRRGTASALTCFVLVLVVFLPGAWIGWEMVQQANEGVRGIVRSVVGMWDDAQDEEWFASLREQAWFEDIFPSLSASMERLRRALRDPDGLPAGVLDAAAVLDPQAEPVVEAGGEPAVDAVPPRDLRLEARRALERALPLGVDLAGRLTSFAAGLLANALEIGLKFVLMVLLLFFFLRDGPQLVRSFESAIPLSAEYQNRVGDAFGTVSRSVIRGSFLTAFAQGVVATIAFAIVGLPAIFWGVMASFCALIPPFGTTLVTVPLIVSLFFEGAWGRGTFLAIVAVLIAGLDNVLRPLLVGESLRMHPIWLLLSILGAMRLFGPMGLVYGPMVLVLLGTFLRLLVQQQERAAAATAPEPGGG